MEEMSIITTSMDQPIPLRHLENALKRVDVIFSLAYNSKDVNIIFESIGELIDKGRTTGISLAKLLYKTDWYWEDFIKANPDMADVEFCEVAQEKFGISKEHISRSVRVWMMHESGEIPEKYKEDILHRNIKDQIAIAACWEKEAISTDNDWQKLAHAPNFNTLSQEKRILEGVPPRKDAVIIKLSKMGDLVAFNQDEIVNVGWLEIESKNIIVKKAINRIVSSAGMILEE